MFALATIFACLSLFGGLSILCLLTNKDLRDSLWLSFLESDFKNIFNESETRPFAIWLHWFVRLNIIFHSCSYFIYQWRF